MDNKQTILSIIKNNAWGIGLKHYELISDLEQHYGIDRPTGEAVINEFLSGGLISVKNERYLITRDGKRYIQDAMKQKYIQSAYEAANVKHLRGKGISLEKWSWIAGIVAALVAVIIAIYDMFIKK